jgi:hypothetical protein
MRAMYYLLLIGAVMLFLSFVAWRDGAAAARKAVKIGQRPRD